MANEEDLARIRQGVAAWNASRQQDPDRHVDLRDADLHGADLHGADLHGADLQYVNFWRANLGSANLYSANLWRANLCGATLASATLWEANLGGANLCGATLHAANFGFANLCGAKLIGANLSGAILVRTDLTNANLTGCRVYGISAWDLKLDGTTQRDLVITKYGEPEITVDNLEVAQFIYLLLNNKKIRDVIDTIGKKGVLLLGRFTGELKDKTPRMDLLERLREELRNRDFVPIVFNFERPEKSDFTETIMTLTGLCCFVIVDITNPRSTPLELQATVPEYMIPFVPILEDGEEPFAMFRNLWSKHPEWVLAPILRYRSIEQLAQGLNKEIIEPALARFHELVKRKAENCPTKLIGT